MPIHMYIYILDCTTGLPGPECGNAWKYAHSARKIRALRSLCADTRALCAPRKCVHCARKCPYCARAHARYSELCADTRAQCADTRALCAGRAEISEFSRRLAVQWTTGLQLTTHRINTYHTLSVATTARMLRAGLLQ